MTNDERIKADTIDKIFDNIDKFNTSFDKTIKEGTHGSIILNSR